MAAVDSRIQVVLLVVAACAAVAVGATGAGLLMPPANLDAAWVRAARLGGTVVAVVGVVALWLQRRRPGASGGRGADPTVGALLAATTIMGVLTVLALLAPVMGLRDGAGAGDAGDVPSQTAIAPEAAGPRPPPSTNAPLTEGVEFDEGGQEPDWAEPVLEEEPAAPAEGFDWGVLRRVLDVLLPVFLLAGLVIALLALADRLRHGAGTSEDDGPLDDGGVEAGLEASLAALAPGGHDPRGQITAAYRRLVAALTAAGAGRRPQEAPHEHLHRALGPLGVRSGPMHRLAELYVAAQFSVHPVTEGHRIAATEALESSLTSLRSGREVSGAGGMGAIPGEAHT